MAEDMFLKTVIGLVLFVAFTWLILSVAIDFGAEYGRDSTEIGEGSLNKVDFQTAGQNVSSSAEGYRLSFESGSVDDIDDPSGIFSTATNIISMITTPFLLLGQILKNIMQVAPFIVSIILGLLSIVLIAGIWRLLRSGS